MSESASVAIKLIRNLNSYNKAASTASTASATSTASARQNLDVLGSKTQFQSQDIPVHHEAEHLSVVDLGLCSLRFRPWIKVTRYCFKANYDLRIFLVQLLSKLIVYLSESLKINARLFVSRLVGGAEMDRTHNLMITSQQCQPLCYIFTSLKK